MRSSSSDFAAKAPPVPDHEMIRQIGKGSYGEVWLARAVTGALRAVKVVSRADFEYDRTFEREFEGIKKFEPISRSHPGLVDILHVGRNLTEGFYYYVMELADDRLSGREIVPELYVPRTLSSDIKEKGQIPVEACADWGAMISDALHHMHGHGLAHRDVKPSNIIFVDGIPKLADIGLVAMSGQRTFVGTEGFVPPEGPGEPGADIYSLGMVLYETSTGLDRLEFPAVPQLVGDEAERKNWRKLNAVVCKACAPSPKQRYASARELRSALLTLKADRALPGTFTGNVLRVLMYSGLVAAGLVALRNTDLFAAYKASNASVSAELRKTMVPERSRPTVTPPEPPVVDPPPPDPPPPVAEFGGVRIMAPPGAKIFEVREGNKKVLLGTARPDYIDERVTPGQKTFEVTLEDHKPYTVSHFVEPGKTEVIEADLQYFKPPREGEPWTNSHGMAFVAAGGDHFSHQPIPLALFEDFLASRPESAEKVYYDKVTVFPDGSAVAVAPDAPPPPEQQSFQTARVTEIVAREFFKWLTEDEVATGYLAEDQYYALDTSVTATVVTDEVGSGAGFETRHPLFAAVHKAKYATLYVDSTPRGASVSIDGREVGTTGVDIPSLPPGAVMVTVQLAGHRQEKRRLELVAGQSHRIDVPLIESDGVVFGEPWENGLGMQLLPLGEGVMMAAYETRLQDYEEYLADIAGTEAAAGADGPPPHRAVFQQSPAHPVVEVSKADAAAFCEWLTARERVEGQIKPSDSYRLPTDREWSRAAGLDREDGATPSERDDPSRETRPWGGAWPPPIGTVNLADESARAWLDGGQILSGYDDGFAYTAPVGSFKPNALGFYDLAGNVWEWVSDPWGDDSRFRDYAVARGGGYNSNSPAHFRSSYRNLQKPDMRDTIYGFRVVLAEHGRQLD